MEKDEHEFMLNHVVLPRYLPPEKPGYVNQLKLMNSIIRTVLNTTILPLKTIDLFKQIKRLHIETTSENFSTELKNEIKTLLPGETFAMFVRRQNCTLLIHQKQNSVILATFRGDMRSCDVYTHDSDIEVIFFWIQLTAVERFLVLFLTIVHFLPTVSLSDERYSSEK